MQRTGMSSAADRVSAMIWAKGSMVLPTETAMVKAKLCCRALCVVAF